MSVLLFLFPSEFENLVVSFLVGGVINVHGFPELININTFDRYFSYVFIDGLKHFIAVLQGIGGLLHHI